MRKLTAKQRQSSKSLLRYYRRALDAFNRMVEKDFVPCKPTIETSKHIRANWSHSHKSAAVTRAPEYDLVMKLRGAQRGEYGYKCLDCGTWFRVPVSEING